MSGGRRVGGDYDEQNAFTGWRRYYIYLARAGATKAIKRRVNRRERRASRQELRKDAA